MFGAEWGVAGEENIDDDAERPEVDGFGVTGRGVTVSGAGENLTGGALAESERKKGREKGRYGARYSSVPTALVIRVVGGIKRADPKSVRTMRAPAALEVQRMLSGWWKRCGSKYHSVLGVL